MIDQETTTATRTAAKRWGTAAAFLAAGLAGGVVLAGTVSANAATSSPSPSATSSTSGGTQQQPSLDPSKPVRSDETLLTGDTAEKVKAAALAKYPGATVERVETDNDGVYEAHVVTTDGTHVIVAVGKDFTVTGTQEMPARGDGQGPQGAAPSASPSSTA